MTPDPIKVEPLAPVAVTIISSMNDVVPTNGTIAKTPGYWQPDLIVRAVTPLVAITIRFLNVYVGSLVGILTGAMASDVIPATDFWGLFGKCAGLALGGSILLLLKDVTTVLSGLEKSHPLASGSV